jgi:hypothetical protein
MVGIAGAIMVGAIPTSTIIMAMVITTTVTTTLGITMVGTMAGMETVGITMVGTMVLGTTTMEVEQVSAIQKVRTLGLVRMAVLQILRHQ